MITAEEAKERCNKAKKERTEDIIVDIDTKLEDRIEAGYSDIYYQTPEDETYDYFLVKAYYETLGYKVSLMYSGEDGDNIKISWY